jgi:hypothetical protein
LKRDVTVSVAQEAVSVFKLSAKAYSRISEAIRIRGLPNSYISA